MLKSLKHLSCGVLFLFVLALSACGDDEVTAVNVNASLGESENEIIMQENATVPAASSSGEGAESEKQKVLGVGFVYVAPIESAGWTHEHDRARVALDKLDGVVTTYVENVPVGPDAERALRSLASKGYNLIAATTYGYEQAVLKVSEEFPDVKFLHAAGVQTKPNVSVFFGRMYQARYLTGMIAGAMTKSNSIGYVAAYPLPEVIRGINAFTLGVRELNPAAEVRVVWTRDWYNPVEEKNAVEFLIGSAGADVVAHHTDSPVVQEVAEQSGIYSVGYHSDMSAVAPNAHLVAAIWNFEPFYTDVVEKLKKGEWEEFDYWEGLDAGIVDISPINQVVPQDVQEQVLARKAEIAEGLYVVFKGPVYDQDGQERVAEDQILSDTELRQMDWFVNGVVVVTDSAENDAPPAPGAEAGGE